MPIIIILVIVGFLLSIGFSIGEFVVDNFGYIFLTALALFLAIPVTALIGAVILSLKESFNKWRKRK